MVHHDTIMPIWVENWSSAHLRACRLRQQDNAFRSRRSLIPQHVDQNEEDRPILTAPDIDRQSRSISARGDVTYITEIINCEKTLGDNIVDKWYKSIRLDLQDP